MNIRIHHGDIHLLDLTTRMPFKYGIATMTRSPHAFVRLEVEVDGKLSTGIAADHLPPKWFTKDPARAIEDEVHEMAAVIEHAVRQAGGIVASSAFDAWRQVWDRQDAWGQEQKLPPLLAHFGTSLVERALLEAVCRAVGQPFQRLLHDNVFGIDLGAIHASLQGVSPAELLPQEPLGQITVRHTVGMADPLTESDIAPAERLDDGLPQSLEASITRYGLRHFKIKVSGALDQDRERLTRIADVLERHAPPDFAFSLDGNEQFRALAPFRAYWETLRTRPELGGLFGHLMFVEQPFHRDVALDPDALAELKQWTARPTLIIDESDGDLTSLPRALALGYAGTSHKNCKGVFKGLANACLLRSLKQRSATANYLMSGEDLANIGPVALLQDLAVCATLGIQSVERNGHHYFAGLSMFPDEVQRQVLQCHGDLYRRSRDHWPTLTIQDGLVDLASVNTAPFGVQFEADVNAFPDLTTWRGRSDRETTKSK
jgi:L-alanine-DL-glutamate epimerase-like enolase superfamily enzyme